MLGVREWRLLCVCVCVCVCLCCLPASSWAHPQALVSVPWTMLSNTCECFPIHAKVSALSPEWNVSEQHGRGRSKQSSACSATCCVNVGRSSWGTRNHGLESLTFINLSTWGLRLANLHRLSDYATTCFELVQTPLLQATAPCHNMPVLRHMSMYEAKPLSQRLQTQLKVPFSS